MITFLVAFCISITVITGLALTIYCGDSKNWIGTVIGFITFIIGLSTIFLLEYGYGYTDYVPAEPFSYNQTQTVFTTDKGMYIADGLYPDGKDVLFVWQVVDCDNG